MRGLLLVGLLVVGACYKYVPVVNVATDLERGMPVRAAMVDRESIDLREYTAHNIVSMDAEFVRLDNSEMVLSALWLDSATQGLGYPGEGWTVRISSASIARLEQKKFDSWKTAGLVAAVTLASYFGWEALGGGGGADEIGPPDPPDIN